MVRVWGLYRDNIGLCRDNGKENENYNLGFRLRFGGLGCSRLWC